MPEARFGTLVDRIRAGDQDAAAELVRCYEPQIRRIVRFRLTDPALRQIVDSLDICQSVFGNFFVRTALGEFDLDSPDQLLRLLTTMARNKIIDVHRRERVRGGRKRRLQSGGSSMAIGAKLAAPGPSPSQILTKEQLLAVARERLSQDDMQIAELRAAGQTWDEIAAPRQMTAEAVRKQFSRACTRLIEELGLEQ